MAAFFPPTPVIASPCMVMNLDWVRYIPEPLDDGDTITEPGAVFVSAMMMIRWLSLVACVFLAETSTASW